MTTLYDLLGALPGDDADDLRDAFRQAVKGVHPDIRPNDPEAALKFRLVVYAMEVLRDPEQRAAYDHLLELARQELVSQQTAARIRNFAFAMIGLASVTVAAAGISILVAPRSATLAPAGQIDGLSHTSPEIGSDSSSTRPPLGDNVGAAGSDAQTAQPAEKQDDFLARWGDVATGDQRAETVKPAEHLPPQLDANDNNAPASGTADTAPSTSAPDGLSLQSTPNDDSPPADRSAETAAVMKQPEIIPPSSPIPPAQHDAASDPPAPIEHRDETDASAVMHAKGITAYHNGDLKLALADFNRAIELNPAFITAYINRGIVLYRMGKLELALADVARARHIDRTRSAAAFHRKRRHAASLIESPPVPEAGL